jgi:tripartite-type tricarboxylate transporter receptor subunit TctC
MLNKLAIATCGALLLATGATLAQNYPTKPITMVVPFAAGGPADVFARLISPRMSETLGQQVIIEAVGGAGGMSGSKRVANAAPDGYTGVIGTVGSHAQSQTMYRKPLYNVTTDFTPVGLLAEVPLVLIVRKDLPASNFQEFVAYSKKNHAKMQFGSAGAGAATHLGCVVLNTAMGTDIAHIPYRGTGPAMQDLVAGRIDFLCEAVSTAKPHIESGNVKALAIMTEQRSPVLPDVPTTVEQGTSVLAYTWYAMFLPKGAPAAIVQRLNAAGMDAVKSPAVRKRLEELGVQVVADDRMTPEYLAQFVKSEIEKWAVPIKASGVIVD